MKRVNLFGLLLAASTMTLASCGETRTPDKGKNVSAWPAASISSFLKDQGVKDDTVVPTFKADTYTFSVKKDDATNFEWFELYAYTSDESSFTSYIEKAKGESWTVVSDDKGAVASKGEVGMEFNKYFKDGTFKSLDFKIFSLAKKDSSGGSGSSSGSNNTGGGSGSNTGTGSNTGSGGGGGSSSSTSSGGGGGGGSSSSSGGGGGGGGSTYSFPSDILDELDAYLSTKGITSTSDDLILPESKTTWASDIDSDTGSFVVYCSDSGTVGKTSIEDTYKAKVQAVSGWSIDDSEYEDYGYFASKSSDDTFEIQFYTYSSSFQWYIYPTENAGGGGGGEGGGGETTDGFPTESANAFLSSHNIGSGLTMVYPSAAVEWTSDSSESLSGDFFYAQCADSGTVGSNSIEDTYKAALEAATGWVVDDSQYDSAGYYATYTGNDEIKIQFYTYEGYFTIYIVDLTSALSSTGFPSTAANSFLAANELASGVSMVYPAGSDTYQYRAFAATSDSDAYFQAVCEDSGTAGVDAKEDAYKALLEGTTGWTVDDSKYDDEGYHATYSEDGSFDILFYTYNGYFNVFISAADGEGGGGGGDIPEGGVTVTINATSGSQDGISWSSAQGDGTSAPALNSSNLRLYQGNTITFTSSSTISAITFNFTFNKKNTTTIPIEPTVSSGTVGTIASDSATTLVVSGINATTVTLTLPMFGGGNMQISTVVVA